MSNASDKADGGKHFDIVVNASAEVWTDNHITYEQVVQLAFPGETGFLYTVTYSNPHGKDGSLAATQKNTVHDGMVFTVGKTNRS